jgi:RNA polymerase sigma-70 factor (ECF subfamily)
MPRNERDEMAPVPDGSVTQPVVGRLSRQESNRPPVDDLTVAAAKRGDVHAWEQVYSAYGRQMMGFLMTQLNDTDDASEALSETFLRALEKVGNFRGDAVAFRAWLYRIARNIAVDRRRARARTQPTLDEEDLVDRGQLGPDDLAINSEDAAEMRIAFATLDVEDRELLWLRVCQGMTSAEAGEIVGKRPGAVRMQQLRALETLSRRLGG